MCQEKRQQQQQLVKRDLSFLLIRPDVFIRPVPYIFPSWGERETEGNSRTWGRIKCIPVEWGVGASHFVECLSMCKGKQIWQKTGERREAISLSCCRTARRFFSLFSNLFSIPRALLCSTPVLLGCLLDPTVPAKISESNHLRIMAEIEKILFRPIFNFHSGRKKRE